jgi:hypothetical protein
MSPDSHFARALLTASLLAIGLLAAGLFSLERRPAVAARLQANWGGGNTSVWVQNLDPRRNATIIARFYEVPGDPPRPPIEIVRRDVAPWAVTIFDSPQAEGAPVAAGQLDQYALIIESDRKVAAINHTEEPFSQSAVAYTDSPIAREMVVPLALRGFSKQEGGTEVSSLVSVESVTPTQALRATFFSKMWSWELENRLRSYRFQPNAPVTIAPGGRGEGGTWAIDLDAPAFDEGPKPPRYEGSVGWLLLEAEQANKLAAQSFINLQMINSAPTGYDSFAVSSFAGIPLEERSNRLFVPLFRSRFFGITGISIVNPDANAALKLRATYYISPLSGPRCGPQTGTQVAHLGADGSDLIDIGPRENVVLYQYGRENPETTPPVRAPGSVGDPRLRPDCFGSVVLEVDPSTPGTVVAMVNDFLVRPPVATADAYQAMRYEDASATVAVPMIRHDATRPAASLYPAAATGIQVMNVDDTPADVTVRFVEPAGSFNAGGRVGSITRRIAPYEAATIYTGAIPELAGRRDYLGSAVVESAGGQRLLASVTIARAGKDTVSYEGFKAEFGAPPIGFLDGFGLPGLALPSWLRSSGRAHLALSALPVVR